MIDVRSNVFRHLLAWGWILLIAVSAASPAHAAYPNLSAVRPVGGQRGTELVVTLSGARLGDAQEVMFYQPGIAVTKIEKIDDNSVKATFAIAPDCPLGIHDLRVRTATGLSELRTFNVGALPEVAEVEPNNDFTAPQAVPFNSVVTGIADNEDVDFFVIDAKKGDRITAEVEGIRLGISLFDPYVAIMDAKRFELASSDDAALVWQDGMASTIAPADGKYIIQVRESAYAGNGSCVYRVHIGSYPRAKALLPAGGKIGETVEVKFLGDVLGDRSAPMPLPAQIARDFGVVDQDDKGVSPFPNPFKLSPYGNVIEVEPNDDQNTATAFEAPLNMNGVIEKAGDIDHFVFPAKKGQAFHIRAHARSIRSPLDPVLYIGKKGGGALAGNDDNGTPDSYIRFGIPEDGDYCIWVQDHLLKGGPDYAYRIELEPIVPKLTMYTADERLAIGSGLMNVAVPKGNRQAILIYASRQDFGGDLNLKAEHLPAGMEMQAPLIYADQPVVPVLFTAKPDAPLAGALANIIGEPADPNVKVPSEFTQNAVLVYGQNNITFWQRTVESLATAVTEESPFSIEVVEPKVPLVQNGPMNLKIIAKRKEGFTEAISVSAPWAPPGVSVAGGIAIPAGQNEVLLTVNANGDAPPRDWSMVINGQANTPGGPLIVSSQLFKLTTAAPYLTMTYTPGSVEQGKEVAYPVTVAKTKDFPGEAQVVLYGLPNLVTTEPQKLTMDTTQLVFNIKTDKTSPAGNHQNLFCQVTVMENGEPVVHNLYGGALRIDEPLPPKADAPAPAATPMPQAEAAPQPPAEKPLTRLEKLRKEHQERIKAQQEQAGQAPPADNK